MYEEHLSLTSAGMMGNAARAVFALIGAIVAMQAPQVTRERAIWNLLTT